MKKLSIITICYNEPNLEKTCESIVNQTWQDFEWIVIDGGSNDETLAIFDKYKNRIDKFVSEPDNGRYDAMNKGIKLADSEYLNFLNAGDCYFYSDILKDIFADKNHVTDILYGNLYMQEKDFFSDYIFALPQKLTKEFLYISSLGHPASFIRKSLFDKYGLYNDKLIIAGDYEQWLVFMKNGVNFEYIPYIVSCFNLNGISNDEKKQNLQINERSKIIEKYFSKAELEILKKNIRKKFKPKYSFWEQIFSVKNRKDSDNNKYKILTIFGLHFKFLFTRKAKCK